MHFKCCSLSAAGPQLDRTKEQSKLMAFGWFWLILVCFIRRFSKSKYLSCILVFLYSSSSFTTRCSEDNSLMRSLRDHLLKLGCNCVSLIQRRNSRKPCVFWQTAEYSTYSCWQKRKSHYKTVIIFIKNCANESMFFHELVCILLFWSRWLKGKFIWIFH